MSDILADGLAAKATYPVIPTGIGISGYKTVSFSDINVTGTAQPAWTPASGKKFRMIGCVLSYTAVTAVILLDGTTEFARIPAPMTSNASVVSVNLGWPGYLSTTTNNILNINTTVNAHISGFFYGFEE